MKVSDIREQTPEELVGKLNDIKKNLFNLKFQKAIGQLENNQVIGNLKKDIARIETLMREKELDINQQVKVKKKSSTKKRVADKKSPVKKIKKAVASSKEE